jgi:hypothetical protein
MMNENKKPFFNRDKKGQVFFSDSRLVVGARIDDSLEASSERTYSIDKILALVESVKLLGGNATLLGFVAGKHYEKDQAIVVDGAIYTAKAAFEAGEAFDPDDWNQVTTGIAAGVGIRLDDIGGGVKWINVELAAPSTEAGVEEVASALETGIALESLREAMRTSLFVEKLGINSLIYPKYFRYDKALTVSKVILSGNATGASFRVEGTEYNQETIIGTTVPVGVDLIIEDINIAAGYDTGSMTIIF